MKKTVFTLIALFVFVNAFSTIRRVNNNPGVVLNAAGPAFVYNNFEAAHAAASTTVVDTIYLEPSDINYGSISITKKIVLIGPGYFLDKNPNTPFDKRTARVNSISFSAIAAGSNISNSSGAIIYGITVQNEKGVLDRKSVV